MMAHQIAYAYEKFMSAVESLSTSDVPLKRRLVYAFDQLHRLDAEQSFGDYPEMADAFRVIYAAYRTVQTGPEGGAAASIEVATGEQATALAKQIFSLFLEIAAEDERLAPRKPRQG